MNKVLWMFSHINCKKISLKSKGKVLHQLREELSDTQQWVMANEEMAHNVKLDRTEASMFVWF